MSKNKKISKVSFPSNHVLNKCQLIQITCICSDESKGTINVEAGIDGDVARKIIDASRYGESDDRVKSSVIFSFSNTNFSGESYGLALSIADKISRQVEICNEKIIYATGQVIPNGAVDAVNDLLEKIKVVKSNAKYPCVFILPKCNLSGDFLEIWQALDSLEKGGIEWYAIEHINDLQGVLWSDRKKSVYSILKKNDSHSSSESKNVYSLSRLKIISLAFTFVIFVVFLFYFNSMFHDQNLALNQDSDELQGSKGPLDLKAKPNNLESKKSVTIERNKILESGNIDLIDY